MASVAFSMSIVNCVLRRLFSGYCLLFFLYNPVGYALIIWVKFKTDSFQISSNLLYHSTADTGIRSLQEQRSSNDVFHDNQ